MPTAEEERTWRTLLSDMWSGIKNAVRIRRNDEPVAAMLPPEQSYFLYENLRLKLQQGRLALLQGHADIYRQSLTEARDALGAYFQPDAVGQGLDAALAELQVAPIQVELPDLSASLRAMQARRALIESQPAAAPADAEAPSA
jgi:uroporphyrin-3 C-methyltransferase